MGAVVFPLVARATRCLSLPEGFTSNVFPGLDALIIMINPNASIRLTSTRQLARAWRAFDGHTPDGEALSSGSDTAAKKYDRFAFGACDRPQFGFFERAGR